MSETDARPVPCPRCGTGMRGGETKTVIWVKDSLYIVEDIPAQICDLCVEQFYDEETTDAIRRLTEEGFPSDELKREVLVPIYSLQKRMQRFNVPSEEQPVPLPAEAQV